MLNRAKDQKTDSIEHLRGGDGQVIRQTFPGLPCSPYVVTGATDAQFYQEICDSCIRFVPIIYGPEEMKGMHGLNETVAYNCLPGAVDFYKNLIRAQEQN